MGDALKRKRSMPPPWASSSSLPSSSSSSSSQRPAPTTGYKVLRADMTSLIDPTCAYALGKTTTWSAASGSLCPGRVGLHFGRTPLECAVDPHVRAALASSFPPPALAFVEVEAAGATAVDRAGHIATDALTVVRVIPTDEWRAMCSGVVSVRDDTDGTARIERYRHGRRHSPRDPKAPGRTLPAIEWPDGRRDWYTDGLLHRRDCDRQCLQHREEATGRHATAIDHNSDAEHTVINNGDDDGDDKHGDGCVRLPAIVQADGTRHWYMHGLRVVPPWRHRAPSAVDRQTVGDFSLTLSRISRWCAAPFALTSAT